METSPQSQNTVKHGYTDMRCISYCTGSNGLLMLNSLDEASKSKIISRARTVTNRGVLPWWVGDY